MGGSAAGGMAVAGNIIGDISGSYGARERGRAIIQQGAELKVSADIEELNAKTTENDLREQLLRHLSSNAAALAASGISASSPSALAALADDNATAGRAIKARNLESLFKTAAMRRDAAQMARQGKLSIIFGKLNSSASALGGSAGAYDGTGGGKAPAASANDRGGNGSSPGTARGAIAYGDK